MRKLVGRACGLTGSGKRPRRRSARSESTTTHMARTRAHPVRTSPPPAARRVNRVKSARAYSSDESARRPPGVARHHGFFTPPAKRRNEPRTLRVGLCRGFYFTRRGWDGARRRNRDAPFFERLPHPLSLRTQFTPLAAHAALAPRVRNLRSHVESGMPHLTSVPADGGRTVPGRLAWQSNCLTIARVGKPGSRIASPLPVWASHQPLSIAHTSGHEVAASVPQGGLHTQV